MSIPGQARPGRSRGVVGADVLSGICGQAIKIA